MKQIGNARQRIEQLNSLEQQHPRSRFRLWKDVLRKDIKVLVVVEIGMGLAHKPSLNSYFQDSFWLTME